MYHSDVFSRVLRQLTPLITWTAFAPCAPRLRHRCCHSCTAFSNVPHACWHVVGALPPPLHLVSRLHFFAWPFLRMQMRVCFSVQGKARVRWLTCSEAMLTVHFDMTFKSHSPWAQMMSPNTHWAAHLPRCGVYCGATDHLYPGPLFICHYKFSRPFCR